jgi:pimeloyl-ACP methyl ester carboxylesterase
MPAGTGSLVFAMALLAPAVTSFAAKPKPTIVLVHGAFQDGASTWPRVQSILEHDGYKVVVVNLPGRDNDGADPKTLTTALYRDTVLNAIKSETAPVVLVGHSFGGITISNVAEAAPEKIKALVYLSAYLPQDGQSLMDLAKTDRDSLMGKPGNLLLNADYTVATIAPDAKADIFANDANDADRQAIIASLIPEAAGPQGMPVKLTAANWGKVPKFYLETTQDHCVSPYLQEQMIAKASLVKVMKIAAGHASYITKPQEVAVGIEFAAKH